MKREGSIISRSNDIEHLYRALTVLIRRSGELSAEIHPGLSLVAYTLLTHIGAHQHVRAHDLAGHFGLDKSTVSRQIDQLVTAGLVVRSGERPGRRGLVLDLTPAGCLAVDDAARAVRATLTSRLSHWESGRIAELAELLTDLNRSLQVAPTGQASTRPDASG